MAIRGITVKLHVKEKTGEDALGSPVFSEEVVEVENVLVSPSTQNEIVVSTNLFGKRAIYTLAIPKEDMHTWENREVEFFNKKFRVIGPAIEGIEEMIPLSWNRKVQVESIEQSNN